MQTYLNPEHLEQQDLVKTFFCPYFPVFGLNTDIYSVNLRIQSKCGKIRTRKSSVFGHFSRSQITDLWGIMI